MLEATLWVGSGSLSGLDLRLPDGADSEHLSCLLERLLQGKGFQALSPSLIGLLLSKNLFGLRMFIWVSIFSQLTLLGLRQT